MPDRLRDPAALAAMSRAFRRGWPARMVEKAAPGWSDLFLTSLRTDPEGSLAVAAALLDEEALAAALRAAGLVEGDDASADAARSLLALLAAG